MKFSTILLGLSWLVRFTAWRNPAFKERLKEKNFVAQIKIADNSRGRIFTFEDGILGPVKINGTLICSS